MCIAGEDDTMKQMFFTGDLPLLGDTTVDKMEGCKPASRLWGDELTRFGAPWASN
jgi:hypothetical protein